MKTGCAQFMRLAAALAAGFVLSSLPGCLFATPDYEHISNRLRDKNLQLQQDLAATQGHLKDSEATIAQLKSATPLLATLPPDRLDQLMLVDRVEIRSMTNASDLQHDGKINGFRVMFRPLMQDGDVLPALGTATIEAFDLSIKDGDNRLGSWTFTPADLKTKWYGGFGLSHFAVDCPWTKPPTGTEVTFTLKFTDALTGRTFSDQKKLLVKSGN